MVFAMEVRRILLNRGLLSQVTNISHFSFIFFSTVFWSIRVFGFSFHFAYKYNRYQVNGERYEMVA